MKFVFGMVHFGSLKGLEEQLILTVNSKRGGDVELEKYASRAQHFAREGDHSVLSKKHDVDYYNYLASLGLTAGGVTRINPEAKGVIPSLLSGKLNLTIPNHISGVMHYSDLDLREALEKKLGFSPSPFDFNSVSTKFIDKSGFKITCKDLNIPIVNGFIYCDLEQEKSELLNSLKNTLETSEVIYRASSGSADSAIITNKNLNSFLKCFFSEPNIKRRINNGLTSLFDPKLEIVENPNLTFYINSDTEILPLTRSKQLISYALAHQGNEFESLIETPNDLTYLYASDLAKKLSETGYTGFVGFDFMETEKGEIYGVEANVRMNGSNLPGVTAQRILENTGSGLIYMKTLPISVNNCPDFLSLRDKLEGDLYSGIVKDAFVVPYNIHRLSRESKVNLMFTGDSKSAIENLITKYT